jgi:hypothetical protein
MSGSRAQDTKAIRAHGDHGVLGNVASGSWVVKTLGIRIPTKIAKLHTGDALARGITPLHTCKRITMIPQHMYMLLEVGMSRGRVSHIMALMHYRHTRHCIQTPRHTSMLGQAYLSADYRPRTYAKPSPILSARGLQMARSCQSGCKPLMGKAPSNSVTKRRGTNHSIKNRDCQHSVYPYRWYVSNILRSLDKRNQEVAGCRTHQTVCSSLA